MSTSKPRSKLLVLFEGRPNSPETLIPKDDVQAEGQESSDLNHYFAALTNLQLTLQNNSNKKV
ncbi:hypothetical protein BC938DRAFT_470671 [Jimgerdemannia flammicorona]|uniref:Uncharacterized protein n=1 Tax=Jimgerdemannia flammicorona TaxID=994334 RepID=A0A433R0B0_9FUNG|nr:hypothetical protein BC938DRAFT_470671 [Jimgerdemannia flammicorona]